MGGWVPWWQGRAVENISREGGRQWESGLPMSGTACELRFQASKPPVHAESIKTQTQGPSELAALCDHTGPTCMKPTLSVNKCVFC